MCPNKVALATVLMLCPVFEPLMRRLRALRAGDVENALILDANDLKAGVINQSHWGALAIPTLLEEELWSHMGAGIVHLDFPRSMAASASTPVVSIHRVLPHTPQETFGWVTRKFVNQTTGRMEFASFGGPHTITVELDSGPPIKSRIEIVNQKTTTVTVHHRVDDRAEDLSDSMHVHKAVVVPTDNTLRTTGTWSAVSGSEEIGGATTATTN